MGYCIEFEDANFTIPAENVDEAFELLKALNHKPGVQKNGGSWGGGTQTAAWFSWMTANYDELVSDLPELFNELRYVTETDRDGNVSIVGFVGEKIGQEDLFFQEISHLANEGWYIEMRGEDGYHWRWTAKGEVAGTVTFS